MANAPNRNAQALRAPFRARHHDQQTHDRDWLRTTHQPGHDQCADQFTHG